MAVCASRLKTTAWASPKRRCRMCMSRASASATCANGCACCTAPISAWKSRAAPARARLFASTSPNSSPPCRLWADSETKRIGHRGTERTEKNQPWEKRVWMLLIPNGGIGKPPPPPGCLEKRLKGVEKKEVGWEKERKRKKKSG